MGTLVVVFIILMLIGFIIEFLKKCGTVLGYIVIAILAIIAIIALFPLIIKLLPYIIAIFAVYFVIHAISNSNTFVKKRANSYLKKLDNKGMDQPEITPKYENSFKWIKENRYAETFLSDYIISIKFYEKVVDYLEQKRELSETEFQNCCVNFAPQFSAKYTDLFVKFLRNKKLLFPFFPPNEKRYYISTRVIKECEDIFEKKGAVTEDQFAAACKGLLKNPVLHKKPSQFAAAILKDMESRGVLHIVPCQENMDLYVSNNPKTDSEMKRIEISLD